MREFDDLTKADTKKPPPRGESPAATPKARTGQLSLLQIMISLIYFAIVFWAIRQYMTTEQPLYEVVVGILIGVGICLVGLRIVWKVPRMAILGWMIVIIGYLVASCSSISLGSPRYGPIEWFSIEMLWSIVIKLILNIPSLLILNAAIVYLSLRRRSNNQNALLGILSLCADRKMPLAAGVQAFSSQVGGIFQVWTETLAELLRRGLSLSESIESLPGLVPPPSRLLIRIGEQSGNLGQGIEQAVASRTVQLPLLRQIGTQIVYLFWVMCCGVFVSFFMMYFIMPRFEAIFKDFGIGLPDVTRNMMMLSHIVVNFSWIPILGGLAFTFAFLINYYTGGGMNIPLFDRLFARRHTILILRGLSISISASQPVSRLLDDLARCYPTNWIRKKLAIAAADVQAGHDWVASMYSTGLLKSSDLGVLTSAQRAGNLVWAVRELVETGERRWSFRLQWIMQLTFLTSMVIIGAIVLFIALAYFSPLIALIMRLSQ